MRIILTVALLLGLGFSAVAQSPPAKAPRTLLELLKPGDLVGVQSSEGTTSVSIKIYSKDHYELAKQISTRGRSAINAQQFAGESELAKKEVQRYVSKHEPSGITADQLMVMPLIRTALGKIVERGEDYVLVKYDSESSGRCAIARSAIGKIYLDANPIRFYGPRPSRTKPE